MWWEHVIIALIAAMPPTIMAGAAWRRSDKTDKKVSTSNGKSAGQMIEASYELGKSTSHRVDEMSKSLEVHMLDADAHCKEQAQYYKDHNGNVVKIQGEIENG